MHKCFSPELQASRGSGIENRHSVPKSTAPSFWDEVLFGKIMRERSDFLLHQRRLRQRFGHASAERALTGPGLENVYRAIGRS
jgi:Glucokinase